MKKTGIILAGVTLAIFTLLVGTSVQADQVSSRENPTVPSGETIDHTYMALGNRITINGNVNGDVYCAAQQVVITGEISGDVLCAAQTITLSGKASIGGNLRVATQNLTLSGNAKVDRVVTAFAQMVDINDSASIGGDLNGMAQAVNINGKVGRDVLIGASDLGINGSVARNVDAELTTLSIDKEAKIGGDLNYQSIRKADIPAGVVAGNVNWSEPSPKSPSQQNTNDMIAGKIIATLTLLALVLSFALLMPRQLDAMTNVSKKQFALAILVGFSALVVMPLIILLMFMTIIGWPLAVLMTLAYLASLIVSIPVSVYYLGRHIVGKGVFSPVLISLVGAVSLAVIMLVPILGALAFFVVLISGIGLILLHLTNWHQTPRLVVVAEAVKKPAKSSPKKN